MRKFTLSLCMATALASFANWTDNPQLLYPVGTLDYANEIATASDGSVWNLIYHPNLLSGDEFDIPNVKYEYMLQRYDSEGNPQFPGELGLKISDYNNISYTMVNQYLFVDRDGNAIVAVSDARNSSDKLLTYTLYKISPDGEFLWDEDGVALDPTNSYGIVAGMRMTQIEDGSYVVAWMHSTKDSSSSMLEVELQRVSADGRLLWDPSEVRLASASTSYSYPYVVSAGDNQVILVYARGGNMDLYARKLDFDGSLAWANDVLIYSGGWGSIPLWTKLTVLPSGDGGVLLSWNDDRNFTQKESAFMSYVTTNGKLGFAGASPTGDVKLGYSLYKAFNCVCLPDPSGDGFLAAWRETDMNQMWSQIVVQKVSKTGELLWDEDGVVISTPIEESMVTYSYISLYPGLEGQSAVFCLERIPDGNPMTTVDFTGNVYLINNKTGNTLEGYDPSYFASQLNNSGVLEGLQTKVCTSQNFWILQWADQKYELDEDGESVLVEYPMIMRLNFDFEPKELEIPDEPDEPDSVESIVNGKNSWKLSINQDKLILNSESGGNVTLNIYDLTGRQISQVYNGYVAAGSNKISLDKIPAGAYVARLTADGRTYSAKIIKR